MKRPPHRSAIRSCAVLLIAAAACVQPQPASHPRLGDFGIDLAGMDPSVAPGDDFYGYVNGNWDRTTEIPADRSRYGAFSLVGERARARTREIVEDAAKDASATGDAKKIAGFYRAFLDEDTIEARGLAPLQPELDAIAAVSDAASLARYLGGTLRADVDLLNATQWHTDRLFGVWITQHLGKPDRCAPYLVQGGLGMPDRDYYLAGDRMAELREKYRAHVVRVLELAKVEGAAARADTILALETSIARAHASAEETADVQKGANYWQRSDFASKAPGLDWAAYWTAAGMNSADEFIVWQPGAVAGIARLVGSEPLASWQDYLRFHALDRASPLLPRAFADEHFAFHGKTMDGTPEQPARWQRAGDAVNKALGEAVGKLYVERFFTAATKARAEAIVRDLLTAFDHRIDALEWMSPATKARAKKKLAGMKIAVGYPESWRDYAALEVRPDDALGNDARASRFEYERNLRKIGKPVDRGEWFLRPHEVNALNLPIENRLIFPAAILEAPFFDPAADDAVNYGGIGAVIGHEVTHSFDSSGALFDEAGRLANWWTPADLEKFDAAGAALAAQFDTYKPFPDLAVNGKLTLGENIADVAGLATALDAYHLSHRGAEAIAGFTPDQRLFLSWAQVWRGKAREPSLRKQLLTNVHAPDRYRALTVRNQDAWYTAFAVRPGQKLYLAPEQRVKVW